MDKEEILAKSRAENKNKDIYEQEIIKQAGEVSFAASALLAVVFLMAQIMVGGGPNFGMWAIVFSGWTATFWVKWRKLRRPHELTMALLYTALVLFFSALHIYALISASTIL